MGDGVRVWMTGAGLVTALGTDRAGTWKRLLSGERKLSPVSLFDAKGQRASVAANVESPLVHHRGGAWSRTSTFAVMAAREALEEARVDPKALRIGLVVGSTTGGMFETEARLAKLHAEPHTLEGQKALIEMLSHPLSSIADCLVDELGPFVRVRTVCSACSSGANALVVGALWLLEGTVDAVLAGGTDGHCRLTLSGFNALGAVDPAPCRPFDRQRRGLNLGEGAGFCVLERQETALARGAKPFAELAGWALGAEAHHITNPEATGVAAARVLSRGLHASGLLPSQIDYVNAHGTGTPLNDPMEANAIRLALGGESARIPVSSSKGQLGHMLGAAGAVEAILSAMAILHQAVPPTAGLEDPDPACDLVHVMGTGRVARVRAVLSNSFGFGGMDSVLVLSEPELGPAHDRPERAAVSGLVAEPRRSVVITGAATLTPVGVLDAHGSTELLVGPARPVRAGPLEIELGPFLDVTRARRLDRPARLGAIVAERALAEATAAGNAVDPSKVGVVLGSAFGSVDASAAFMHRVFEKGSRFASPGEFPNLVPSSPVGHVSIYLGLRGPALAIADLATSGESAVAEACELVRHGEAEVVLAGAVEEASDIAERILVGLFARSQAELGVPRGEGAAAVVLESAPHAEARGARVLARVVALHEWHDGARDPLKEVVGPRDAGTSRVVLSRETGEAEALLRESSWQGAARLSVGPRAGQHEALGAVALAAAAGLLGDGSASEVLVIGLAKGRGYALVLAAP